MPGKDGRGPADLGRSGNSGGQSGCGSGRGRRGSSAGVGPGGYCECPKCGTRAAHKPGQPCSEMQCPQCGSNMVRV
jgi:hypothetical protein